MKKYIAIVGEDFPTQMFTELSQIEYIVQICVIPADMSVDSPIATHPDTIFCVFQGTFYCHKEYAKKNKALLEYVCQRTKLTLCPIDCKRGGKYPHDIAFNALCGDDFLIGKKDSLCSPLQFSCIDTKQGYAACSALLYEDHLITDDPSIIKAGTSISLNCHCINKTEIKLKGYPRGFLGGACGIIPHIGIVTVGSANTDLSQLCKTENIPLIQLGKEIPLTDVGGIKFLEMK